MIVKYIRLCISFWNRHSCMGIKEATYCDNLINKSIICSKYISKMSSNMDAKNFDRLDQKEPTPIFCDNKSTIAPFKNQVFHKKSKHIDTMYYFICELVNNGEIILEYCRFEDLLADIFTEALPREQFEYLRENLGIVSNDLISARN